MGTSVNQHSPDTSSWKLVRALLGQASTPAAIQASELWRAAAADRASALATELADPLLAQAAALAQQYRKQPLKALKEFDSGVVEGRSNNFALELGRRALARASLQGTGAAGFAAELFSETTSYYVARDLPGLVGSPARVKTVRDALTLKSQLQGVARESAAAKKVSSQPRAWAAYVSATIDLLKRGGRRR